jgi:hypothetical protein
LVPEAEKSLEENVKPIRSDPEDGVTVMSVSGIEMVPDTKV